MKRSIFLRLVGLGMVILPTLLLLWVVVDLLLFSLEPWPYDIAMDTYYLLLKESPFWRQYIAFDHNFESKWITSVVWHFSWLFSLLGIMLLTKHGPNPSKKYSDAPITRNVLLNYVNMIQLVLYIVGTYAVRFKKYSFFNIYGDLVFGHVLLRLILIPPFSTLPQFFLAKIFSRRTFQKIKFKRDYVIIPLLMIGLLLSFVFFGRQFIQG